MQYHIYIVNEVNKQLSFTKEKESHINNVMTSIPHGPHKRRKTL